MQFEALMPFVTLDGGRIKRKTNNEDTLVFIVNIEIQYYLLHVFIISPLFLDTVRKRYSTVKLFKLQNMCKDTTFIYLISDITAH